MIKITILAMIAVFYFVYFAKQISQRRRRVSTMILDKCDMLAQKGLEITLKVATFTMSSVRIPSIGWEWTDSPAGYSSRSLYGLGLRLIVRMLTFKGSKQ